MLTRVLFGVVGFVFVLLALFVFPPLVLQLALALLCALATYELLCPTGLVKSHKMVLLCTLVSLGYSLSETDLLLQNPMHGVIVLVLELVLLLGLFACLLRRYRSDDRGALRLFRRACAAASAAVAAARFPDEGRQLSRAAAAARGMGLRYLCLFCRTAVWQA